MTTEPGTVCASCGRRQDGTPWPDCTNADWHEQQAEPVEPRPALAGDDLVQHLQRSRASLEDQLQYASSLIAALTCREPDRTLYVSTAELVAVEHLQLQTWTDTAGDRVAYRVTG